MQRICKVTALRLAVNAWAAATASSCLAYTSLAAVTETESASPTVSGGSSSCLCEELAWIDARVVDADADDCATDADAAAHLGRIRVRRHFAACRQQYGVAGILLTVPSQAKRRVMKCEALRCVSRSVGHVCHQSSSCSGN